MSVETINLEEIKTLEDAIGVIRILLLRIENLERENRELRLENQELREEISRLRKNSSTSSKPPSSDITKPESEQRQRGKRKRGGQVGHKGFWRQKVEADEVRELHIEQCPKCGMTDLGEENSENIKSLQQAELVIKPVEVIEYVRFGRFCPCCNKVQYPNFPEGVISGLAFGPKLLTLCGYMKSTMGVSVSELRQFFTEVLNLPVARSTIQNAIFRVSDALAPCHEEVLQALPAQEHLNVDETGWKENGQRQWVWLFCTAFIACFTIRASRGCQVLKDVLGEVFQGAITSDFYSAYVSYATALQQFCLAHLIRELKFLTTLPHEETKIFGDKLLSYMRRLFTLWHNRQNFTPEQFQKRVSLFENTLRNYLFAQKFEKGSDSRRIQLRMVKHWDSLFRFLKQPDLFEPTNNAAERDLRHLVRLRRISQGSRGRLGQLWTARAATVVISCRKQRRNPWQFIQHAVSAHFFNSQPPSLLLGS
jgi:transposase